VAPILQRAGDFARLIALDGEDTSFADLRAAEGTGRPLGNADFIAGLERILGRRLARRAPRRKPRATPKTNGDCCSQVRESFRLTVPVFFRT
jgi:putative transposase